MAAAARQGARRTDLRSSPLPSRLPGLGQGGISLGTSWCEKTGLRPSPTPPPKPGIGCGI